MFGNNFIFKKIGFFHILIRYYHLIVEIQASIISLVLGYLGFAVVMTFGMPNSLANLIIGDNGFQHFIGEHPGGSYITELYYTAKTKTNKIKNKNK